MKIMWVSPHGDGWSIAAKLRDSGNRVVYWCPDHKNKNGANLLPQASAASWLSYATRSDLVIVDGNFDSRPTRRSWEPSDAVRDLQQLRHRGVRVVGPTPTTELLENDPRYLRKFLGRAGLSTDIAVVGEVVMVTISLDPDGRCFLVFRHRHLLGEGNGPELGNLGDVVVPIPSDLKLVKSTVDRVYSLIERTGFSSYLNLALTVTEHGVHVDSVHCRFIYPAVFSQVAHLLAPVFGASNQHGMDVGLAVTLLRLDDNGTAVADDLGQASGFFGCDLMGDDKGGKGLHATGPFLGAVVGHGASWNSVQQEVYADLATLVRPGWGYRPGVGSNVFNQLEILRSWGWL